MNVSVLIITYNHARVIADAIDSALGQVTSFPYEIVVSEDCSTDGTREIVEQYERRHPEHIHVLYSARNLGGTENFVDAYRVCRGEYVALLEGDDYWTSPSKLEKQVAFLSRRPECSMCVHPVTEVHEATGRSVSWMDPE